MKYFAYGSNMYTKRLQERVPSCKFYALASISGYTLRFHKRSIDKSGKCNAFHTGLMSDCVRGVVFEIDQSEKCDLDVLEGSGSGYYEKILKLDGAREVIEAYTYLADTNSIDESLTPYTWYKDLVVAGMHEHDLPEEYILCAEAVVDRQDHDECREIKNRKQLLK